MHLDNTIAARFWACVDKNGPTQPHMDTPCWLWTGSGTTYGHLYINSHRVPATHISVTLDGRDPQGQLVCHRCDTPLCVRPEHLVVGTTLDNVRDMFDKGRGRPPAQRTGEFGRNLRLLREAAGMTQTELARAMGIAQPTLSDIESGRRLAMSVAQTIKACRILNADPELLAEAAIRAHAPGFLDLLNDGMRHAG